jgi:NTP pyrophosphatase (non-canonical NTP hydrolase)
MSDIDTLTKIINKWVRERGWDKFQKPKDLAISLSLEVAEVLEHFQWRSESQFVKHLQIEKESFGDELADVAIYLFKLADKTKVDLPSAIKQKLKKASKKYPLRVTREDRSLSRYYKTKKEYRNKK